MKVWAFALTMSAVTVLNVLTIRNIQLHSDVARARSALNSCQLQQAERGQATLRDTLFRGTTGGDPEILVTFRGRL